MLGVEIAIEYMLEELILTIKKYLCDKIYLCKLLW